MCLTGPGADRHEQLIAPESLQNLVKATEGETGRQPCMACLHLHGLLLTIERLIVLWFFFMAMCFMTLLCFDLLLMAKLQAFRPV